MRCDGRQHTGQHIVAVDDMMLDRGGDVNEDRGDQQRVEAQVNDAQRIAQRAILRDEIG